MLIRTIAFLENIESLHRLFFCFLELKFLFYSIHIFFDFPNDMKIFESNEENINTNYNFETFEKHNTNTIKAPKSQEIST